MLRLQQLNLESTTINIPQNIYNDWVNRHQIWAFLSILGQKCWIFYIIEFANFGRNNKFNVMYISFSFRLYTVSTVIVMNNSALKESTVEKNTQTYFMWIRKKVSFIKSYEYELAFDTSKPFHYRVWHFIILLQNTSLHI